MHRLWQHQKGTSHKKEEEVEEEQCLEKEEVGKNARTETSADSFQRHLPQLERVQDGQPAVPTLPCSLKDIFF